jgi:hypothetical protein
MRTLHMLTIAALTLGLVGCRTPEPKPSAPQLPSGPADVRPPQNEPAPMIPGQPTAPPGNR